MLSATIAYVDKQVKIFSNPKILQGLCFFSKKMNSDNNFWPLLHGSCTPVEHIMAIYVLDLLTCIV